MPRQNSKQKRRKNPPAISASYDPSCVCSIVQFWWPPVFWEAHLDILRVLSQSEKLLIAFHPCLLCSDLNARCLMLEAENPGCFDDPDKTFIDLYMKSGLYITEIVKRLYQSEQMKKQFPDPKERLRHIFEK